MTLSEFNLQGVVVSDRVDLSSANLSGANLSQINLRYANLGYAILHQTYLMEADFQGI